MQVSALSHQTLCTIRGGCPRLPLATTPDVPHHRGISEQYSKSKACKPPIRHCVVATRSASEPAVSGREEGKEWELEIEELMKLLDLLPPDVRSALEQHPEMCDLLEVVCDLGRPPVARFPSGDVRLSEKAITQEDLMHAVSMVGDFGGDNRAGIDRTLHRISCMRNRSGKVIGLTCRVGRAIKGSAEMVHDLVLSGASILLLGRPGVGKTTAIREVSRMLAEECKKRVVIVDTSNEIGGDGDVPHMGIGRARRMQVPVPEEQHRVMIEAVENHMPQVIVIDEIGTAEECGAARTIAQRGVQLVATAHGNELENVVKNPSLADLVGGIQSVTLGDEEARRRGVQKSILERAGPATFDVCVEMFERTKWKVHLDVGQAVDLLLAGGDPGGQVRERAADGSILKYNYSPSISGAIAGAPRGNSNPLGGGKAAAPGSQPRERERDRERDQQRQSSGADASTSGQPSSPRSSFVRDSSAAAGVAQAQREAAADEADEWGSSAARKIQSRQQISGLSADTATLRLFTYELDQDNLWQVMSDMQLTDKVFITSKLVGSDAVLALRSKVKSNAALRSAARDAGVPVYAVKSSGQSNLFKAFRTLLGVDPSAGGLFGALGGLASVDQLASASMDADTAAGPMSSGDEEEGTLAAIAAATHANKAEAFPASPKAPRYSARQEDEALEEVEMAAESIVLPLGQPAELLPRAPHVVEAQVRLLEKYQLPHEVVGEGTDMRLRILPRPVPVHISL